MNKYEKIYEDIVSTIESGKLKTDEKLPTELDLATSYGVSRITATRAYKELVLNGYVYRVKGHGTYVKNRFVRKEKHDEGMKFISVILRDNVNMSDFLHGVEEVMNEEGYLVTFHNTMNENSKERRIINNVIKKGTSGIILYPNDIVINMNLYSNLIISKFPIVTIDRSLPNQNVSFVSVNNYESFYNLTDHIIKKGHKRIIFVGTKVFSISSEKKRYEGFCQAHLDNKLPLHETHLVYENDYANWPDDVDKNSYEKLVEYYIENLLNIGDSDSPTAIMCVNDGIAKYLISGLLNNDIKIPQEIAVTGFDDMPFSKYLPVPLTTVKQPNYELGRVSAKELLDTITDPNKKPEKIRLSGKIVIRDSV